MKIPVAVVLGVVFISGVCAAADQPVVKEQKDKISYSVGYQVGSDFKRQGVALNPELLVKGAKDALSGAQPLLSPQEMNKTLVDLKRKIVADEKAKQTKIAEKNLKEGKAFLERNAKAEGVVTLPSGLQLQGPQGGDGSFPQGKRQCDGALSGHLDRRNGVRQLL